MSRVEKQLKLNVPANPVENQFNTGSQHATNTNPENPKLPCHPYKNLDFIKTVEI